MICLSARKGIRTVWASFSRLYFSVSRATSFFAHAMTSSLVGPCSGSNYQTPELLERKVPIVAMTSDGDNLLRQKAKYTLTISSRERLYDKISTFSTETSILFIFNIIFSCYFQREYEANLKQKIQKGEKLEEPRMAGLPKS